MVSQHGRASAFAGAFLGNLLVVAGLSFSAACSDESCSASSNVLKFTEKSSLGFSANQALADQEGQSGTLSWNAPPEWLSYDAAGETEIVTEFEHDGRTLEEQSGVGAECGSQLQGGVRMRLATADGQLAAEVNAELLVFGEGHYEIKAPVEAADLQGAFTLASNATLVLIQEVSDGQVEGRVLALVEEFSDETGRLRQTVVARWDGEVGTAMFPEPVVSVPPVSTEPELIVDEELPAAEAGAPPAVAADSDAGAR